MDEAGCGSSMRELLLSLRSSTESGNSMALDGAQQVSVVASDIAD
jgi:hypothetical protein